MRALQTPNFTIEIEPSEIPWLKLFAKEPYKESSQAPFEVRSEAMLLLHEIELLLIDYYQPEKINIASFGNYCPHLHWHIMARFKEDSYFPEPMWGKIQRQGSLNLPDIDSFMSLLEQRLVELF